MQTNDKMGINMSNYSHFHYDELGDDGRSPYAEFAVFSHPF